MASFNMLSYHKQRMLTQHNHDNVNTLSPSQNGCHFPDNTFKCISDENIKLPPRISL